MGKCIPVLIYYDCQWVSVQRLMVLSKYSGFNFQNKIDAAIWFVTKSAGSGDKHQH